MPLSPPPVTREVLHLRDISLRGYHRADGLFDIEGRVRDTKAYGFNNYDRGRVEAGEALHDMWVRLTIDETMEIKAVEAVTDAAPYNGCDTVPAVYQRLVGLRVGPGFNRAVKERAGGVQGCTHIGELMGQLATVAFQTMAFVRRRRPPPPPTRERPPGLINTCFSWRSDGPVVQRVYPDFYTGSAPPPDEPPATEEEIRDAAVGGAGALAEAARES